VAANDLEGLTGWILIHGPLYVYEFNRSRPLHFRRDRDLCFFQNRIGCL